MMAHLLAGAGMLALTAAAAEEARDYPIRPVPLNAVEVLEGFWADRMETNRKVTVWYDFRKCEETGRLANFAKAGGRIQGEFRGTPWDDSDVFKVIEGAAYTLATHPDPKLDRALDDLIADIASAQEPDGYLYTARRLLPPEKMPGMSGRERWSNMGASHELYNVGHLYEAAVAHFQATGKRSLLDVAIRSANHLMEVFGPGKRCNPPGHQEVELALVKLTRVTGDERTLQLARFFLDQRGRPEGHRLYGPGIQDHKPVVEQEEAVGHAVRAGYMYSGMTDIAALTGDGAYLGAIDRLWENVVGKKLHLTGGVGASRHGEAFGDAYDLPNRTSYNETCAAIANGLWNHRMFLLHGDGKYLDVLERVIYNGFLVGVAMTGDAFFYPNPLEADGRTPFNHGSTTRQPWFGCSCCPVNVVRFIPSVAGFAYATRGDAAYVNLYLPGTGRMKVAGGDLTISQETCYPWEGKVKLSLDRVPAAEMALCLRVPGWVQGRPVPSDLYRYLSGEEAKVEVKVNGRRVSPKVEKGFVTLRRRWKRGDRIELILPMPVRRVLAHEAVQEDAGRVALERGPIVYCVEGVDHDGHALNLVLPDDARLTVEHRPELLGGVTVVRGEAQAAYLRADGGRELKPVALTAVPYYAWNHRGAGEMAVWLARDPEKAVVPPPPTLASSSKTTASHVWTADSVAALNDQVEPASSIDHDIPRFTWWDHRGTAEWVQYDLKEPASVSAVEVYWFDDTGRGSCRVPQSWQLLFRDGGEWKPVKGASEYGTKQNAYNRVTFKPVKTGALRLEVQLQPGVSGGILEWKVE